MRTILAVIGVLALMSDTTTEEEFWTQIVIGVTCLLLSMPTKKVKKDN